MDDKKEAKTLTAKAGPKKKVVPTKKAPVTKKAATSKKPKKVVPVKKAAAKKVKQTTAVGIPSTPVDEANFPFPEVKKTPKPGVNTETIKRNVVKNSTAETIAPTKPKSLTHKQKCAELMADANRLLDKAKSYGLWVNIVRGKSGTDIAIEPFDKK